MWWMKNVWWPSNQINLFHCVLHNMGLLDFHDDVIKWKHFPRYWPFVRGIHRSPVNSPHKGQWRGALMFSLICIWIKGWVNNREAGDLRRCHAHFDVIVMAIKFVILCLNNHKMYHLINSSKFQVLECQTSLITNKAWLMIFDQTWWRHQMETFSA